jgi:hypothetical protein
MLMTSSESSWTPDSSSTKQTSGVRTLVANIPHSTSATYVSDDGSFGLSSINTA